jgi:hypothetical protein
MKRMSLDKPRLLLLLFALAWASAPALLAAEQAWVMSIPHALSGQQVYKVRILAIDGQAQSEVFQFAVAPGARRITVELMLDVEWEPDLVEGERPPAVKEFELEVKAGKTYQLAARVDINAPAESQLDQSYWEVFLYAVD